jgi:hypothetical protein
MVTSLDDQTKLESIQTFLEDFREIRKKHKPFLTSEEFMNFFQRFRDEYTEIKINSARRQLSEAPQYNIFQVLEVSRSEVRTHSAFLCDLLSPRSSHGQGLLFLRTFLEHCAGLYPDQFPILSGFDDPGKWLVFSEFHIGNGRMDIIIQNPQEGFICVIENKVDAYEGDDQLKRYAKWLEIHKKEYPASALCFLTIKGDSSLTIGNYPYLRLSYRQEIAEWLEDTIPLIQAPGVKAVVHQYQAIAATL